VDWSELYQFHALVMQAEQSEFMSSYAHYFLAYNAIDYFLFINLLRRNNTGNNLYLARYDGQSPYFYMPWDLDGSFGNNWQGLREDITDDLFFNGFLARLWSDCRPGGFRQQLRIRWQSLRSGPLQIDSLLEPMMAEVSMLQAAGVYEREAMAWPEYSYNPQDTDYLANWTARRLAYLDQVFSEPCAASEPDPYLMICPNPGNAWFSLHPLPEGDYTLLVYSSTGQVVYSERFTGSGHSFYLGNLTPGIYSVRLLTPDLERVGKLVLQE
jgi:spore coat protein H